ncbi:MAG: hypothetical protein BWY74_01818 [Firmicutes bacterium ADurb.Bin419]|nr:MAG: hypothetical protein BWY74_01818 [Firmicutes bacterium ADurb.Bin419]
MSKIDEYKQRWHDECLKEGKVLWKKCKVDDEIDTAFLLKKTVASAITVPIKKRAVFEYYCKYEGLLFEYLGTEAGAPDNALYSLSGWDAGLLDC